MATKSKKQWTTPKVTLLGRASDAIRHYIATGKPEHAAAIERLQRESSPVDNESDSGVSGPPAK